jgi:K+-transporting ATPase KdpF subunit
MNGQRWGLPALPKRSQRSLQLLQGVKGFAMLLLASIVTVLLFVYLLAALLRPEWF